MKWKKLGTWFIHRDRPGLPRRWRIEQSASAHWHQLNELFDGQVSIDQKLRATGKVGDRRGAHVNSQPMIQRRKDFLVMQDDPEEPRQNDWSNR